MLAWQRHEPQLSEHIPGPARGSGRACLSCNRLISLAGSNTPRSCRHTVVEASTVLTPQPRGGGSESGPIIVTASLFARLAISAADRSSMLVRSASLHATNRGGRWLPNKLYSVARHNSGVEHNSQQLIDAGKPASIMLMHGKAGLAS